MRSMHGGSGHVVSTRDCCARGSPDRTRAADKFLFFFTKITQLWARAAHLLQWLGRLSLPPSEGR